MASNTECLLVRVTPATRGEIDTIAQREDESKSTILRRIIRRGLEHERGRADRSSTPTKTPGASS
jgi:hypothetical protein